MILAITGVYGLDFNRRQVNCDPQCANVAVAATVCSNAQCLCPTLSASGPACVNCLSASGDATGAYSISSYLATECPLLASVEVCSARCASVTSLATACNSKAECICPTLSVIGPPCASCLAVLSDNSDAIYVSSILATDCPSVASAAVCSAQCASITSAASACNTNVQCLCPTLSVIGPPCFACLSSLGLGSDVSSLSSYLATDCPIVASAVICSAECSNIIQGASSCSDASCICPTLSASGAGCISCLAALGDHTDAATISSYLANDCGAAPQAQPAFPLITLPPVTTPATNPTTVTTTVSGPTQNTASVSSQTRSSGAYGSGIDLMGTGYIQIIMLFSLLAGLLSVLI